MLSGQEIGQACSQAPRTRMVFFITLVLMTAILVQSLTMTGLSISCLGFMKDDDLDLLTLTRYHYLHDHLVWYWQYHVIRVFN